MVAGRYVLETTRPVLSPTLPTSVTWPSRRQAITWFLAPALLLAVAGVHSYLVEAKKQTPWEGGGFGMFSTMDKRQARFDANGEVHAWNNPNPDLLDTYLEEWNRFLTA